MNTTNIEGVPTAHVGGAGNRGYCRETVFLSWKTIDNKEADVLAKEPVYLHVHDVDRQMP